MGYVRSLSAIVSLVATVELSLERPAALDVASNGPPESCKAIPVDGPAFVVSPISLGESEAHVRSYLGEPDEVWGASQCSRDSFRRARVFLRRLGKRLCARCASSASGSTSCWLPVAVNHDSPREKMTQGGGGCDCTSRLM